jgi:hypothetical protein
MRSDQRAACRVGTRQQRLIFSKLFHHVAEIAEIMNQQFDRLIAQGFFFDDMQQLDDNIFEFRPLQVDRHLKGAFDRHTLRRTPRGE